jgi:hypothetical protein
LRPKGQRAEKTGEKRGKQERPPSLVSCLLIRAGFLSGSVFQMAISRMPFPIVAISCATTFLRQDARPLTLDQLVAKNIETN